MARIVDVVDDQHADSALLHQRADADYEAQQARDAARGIPKDHDQ